MVGRGRRLGGGGCEGYCWRGWSIGGTRCCCCCVVARDDRRAACVPDNLESSGCQNFEVDLQSSSPASRDIINPPTEWTHVGSRYLEAIHLTLQAGKLGWRSMVAGGSHPPATSWSRLYGHADDLLPTAACTRILPLESTLFMHLSVLSRSETKGCHSTRPSIGLDTLNAGPRSKVLFLVTACLLDERTCSVSSTIAH